jgi:predicted ABC-type ATPase
MSEKKIIIIAGPKGAGKSTFAKEFLPNEAGCPTFVNADLIAAGLSPFDPEAAAIRAGRLMLLEMKAHAKRGSSFAFETTLAGLSYVKHIREWRRDDYHVKLLFLSLKTPENAIARIAARVRQGGHFIPDEVVRRRFYAGLKHFKDIYQNEVNLWQWYENSSDVPQLIEEGENP